MLNKPLKIFLTSLTIIIVSYSQQHTIMTYNLLNYPGSTSATRNPHFITVLSNTEPDIIVAQEMLSQAGVNEFLSDVLMQVSTDYVAGVFINGIDTDNAIFFKSSLFSFIANNPINTALRDINEFVLMHNASGDTIHIYSLHLKASQGSTNEQKRAAEVDNLRKVTDALHPGANFIIAGDFNIYYSNEPAYQKLLEQTNSGYVLDPIDSPGNWHNNFSFVEIHTQSPRTRQFGGGANGGMDDRFDMILTSQSISDEGGITYVMDSYTAYGNDGMHFNDSLNAPPNTAVGQEIADAIHYASDHIPLFVTFSFEKELYITVLTPNGGEVWCDGTTQNITWDDNIPGNVEIQLFKGGVFNSSISTSTPSDGSYTWSFPGGMNPSSGYQIKISSVDNNNIFDFSDSTFIIGCNINIISPNGGEVWLAGTSHTITWESNVAGDVTIDLYKGGTFHSIITGSTPNDSSMIWDLPTTLVGFSDYRVKIASLDDPSIFDASDTNFTIIGNQIIVISPNGGEVWYAGTTETILWTSSFSLTFEIQLFKGGVFHSVIWSSSGEDAGFSENAGFDWSIPPDISSGLDYTVKIISLNYSNVFDISDSSFSIISSEITVISPNGGEIWPWGTTQDITWSSTNVINVKIELSLNNGASWSTIIDSTANSGIYSWLANPPQPSNQSLIRISDVTNENIIDQSDNVFTIDIAPSVEDEFSGIPNSYKLLQNYPNPFNPSTTIYYALPEKATVKITIYDVLGNEVMVYSEDKQETGYHKIEFDATEYRSGIYFYKLQAGDFTETKKMVLMK